MQLPWTRPSSHSNPRQLPQVPPSSRRRLAPHQRNRPRLLANHAVHLRIPSHLFSVHRLDHLQLVHGLRLFHVLHHAVHSVNHTLRRNVHFYSIVVYSMASFLPKATSSSVSTVCCSSCTIHAPSLSVITVTNISNTILKATINCLWEVQEETTEVDNRSQVVWEEVGIKEWLMIESNNPKREEPKIKIAMRISEEKV